MCLDKLQGKYVRPGFGWKLLREHGGDNPPTAGGIIGMLIRLPLNEWVTDTNNITTDIYIDGVTSYKTGFHIFKSLEGAISFAFTHGWRGQLTVHKVAYRKVVAYGQQNGDRVIVAKEIKNLGARNHMGTRWEYTDH